MPPEPPFQCKTNLPPSAGERGRRRCRARWTMVGFWAWSRNSSPAATPHAMARRRDRGRPPSGSASGLCAAAVLRRTSMSEPRDPRAITCAADGGEMRRFRYWSWWPRMLLRRLRSGGVFHDPALLACAHHHHPGGCPDHPEHGQHVRVAESREEKPHFGLQLCLAPGMHTQARRWAEYTCRGDRWQ